MPRAALHFNVSAELQEALQNAEIKRKTVEDVSFLSGRVGGRVSNEHEAVFPVGREKLLW